MWSPCCAALRGPNTSRGPLCSCSLTAVKAVTSPMETVFLDPSDQVGAARDGGGVLPADRSASSNRSWTHNGVPSLQQQQPQQQQRLQQQRAFVAVNGVGSEACNAASRGPKGGQLAGAHASPSKARGYSMYINCTTWASDSHGLFDYESRNVAKKTYRINCMRELLSAFKCLKSLLSGIQSLHWCIDSLK